METEDVKEHIHLYKIPQHPPLFPFEDRGTTRRQHKRSSKSPEAQLFYQTLFPVTFRIRIMKCGEDVVCWAWSIKTKLATRSSAPGRSDSRIFLLPGSDVHLGSPLAATLFVFSSASTPLCMKTRRDPLAKVLRRREGPGRGGLAGMVKGKKEVRDPS